MQPDSMVDGHRPENAEVAAGRHVPPERMLAAGAAGMAVGAVTGMMSQKQLGTLENVAGPLVGSHDAKVGMAVHLAATAATGSLYGLLPEPGSLRKAAVTGAAFGGAVWAAGPMVGVHLLNDMPFQWGKLEKMSLVGHVMWGVGVGVGGTLLTRKLRERRADQAVATIGA